MSKHDDLMNGFHVMDKNFDFELLQQQELSQKEKKLLLDKVLKKVDLQVTEGSTSDSGATPDNVVQLTEPEASYKKPVTRGIRKRRSWIAVVAATIVLAVAGLAVAGVVLDKNLSDFWQADAEQSALLGQHGAAIDAQAANNGTTIDVRQVIGDSHNVYVLFDIIAPAGTVLDAEQYYFSEAFVKLGQGSAMGYYFEPLADDNPDDNKVPMLLLLDAEKELVGQKMTLEFKDIQAYDLVKGDFDVILPGQWTVEFSLEYTSLSEKYPVKQNIVVYDNNIDLDCTLKSLELSPLSATLSFKRSFALGENEEQELAEGLFDKLQITMKDGTVVGIRSGGSSTNLTNMVVSYQFDRMIDPAEIDKIEFMGQQIEL